MVSAAARCSPTIPQLRRCLAAVLFGALVATACSADADQTPAAGVPDAETSTTTTPDAGDDDVVGNDADGNTSPDSSAEESQPQDSDQDAAGNDDQSVQSADLDSVAQLAGQIVRLSDSGSIIVSDPDGGDEVTLDDGSSAQNNQPTWSNDGSRVAWSAVDVNGPRLSISSATGTDRVDTAAPTPAFFLSWSETDAWIAGLGPGPAGVELFFTDTSSSELSRIGSGQPFYIDWISGEDLVAAVSGQDFVDISTDVQGPPSTRTLEGELGRFQAPAALDADRTVISQSAFLSDDIVIVGPGTQEQTIASADGPVAFSPNPVSEEIAVLVTRTQPLPEPISASVSGPLTAQQDTAPPSLQMGRVSVIDSETAEVTTIDIPEPIAMAWSPDGSTLAVLAGDTQQGFAWSFARGDQVIDGQRFIPSPTSVSSYLPFADQYDRSSTWWSPDSAAFVFAGSVSGESGVFVDIVEDDLGAARIGDGQIAFWSPAP